MLDTNVLVAAIRSRRGASFQVLSRVGTGVFEIAVSVPLVVEYEAAMLRQIQETRLRKADVEAMVDYLCSVALQQPIFYLWRPLLKDPSDDMVAEVAVAAGSDGIVTHNRRDFAGVAAFGVRIWSPGEFLQTIGVKR